MEKILSEQRAKEAKRRSNNEPGLTRKTPLDVEGKLDEEFEANRLFYERKERKILSMLSKFHLQFRMHTNLSLNILSQKYEKLFNIGISGLDMSMCNPCGAFEARISLMMRKFHIDHYTVKSEMKTTQESQNSSRAKNKVLGIGNIDDHHEFTSSVKKK